MSAFLSVETRYDSLDPEDDDFEEVDDQSTLQSRYRHDLSQYYKRLTTEQKSLIMRYATWEYIEINRALRSPLTRPNGLQNKIVEFARQNSKRKKDMIPWTPTQVREFQQILFSAPVLPYSIYLYRFIDMPLQKVYTYVKKLVPNQIYEFKGFNSTSTDPNFMADLTEDLADGKGAILNVILVAPGTHLLPIRRFSKASSQYEVVLPHGALFRFKRQLPSITIENRTIKQNKLHKILLWETLATRHPSYFPTHLNQPISSRQDATRKLTRRSAEFKPRKNSTLNRSIPSNLATAKQYWQDNWISANEDNYPEQKLDRRFSH